VLETLEEIEDKPAPISFGSITHHISDDDLQGIYTVDLHDASNGLLLESLSFSDHEPMVASVLAPIIFRHNKVPKIRSAKSYADYLAAIHDEPLIPIFSFRLPRERMDGFILRIELVWRNGQSYLDLANPRFDKECAQLLERLFPDGPRSGTNSSWSPEDFYETVHVPPADMELFPQLQQDFLDCSLYPFQKRTVQFLLNREGAAYENGRIVTRPHSHQHVPFSFRKEMSGYDREIYVSHPLGTVVDDIAAASKYTWDIHGGILAEEMGLGKTVELIALIRLHQRSMPKSPSQIMDPYTGQMVSVSKATLIVTPVHLLQQWKDELALHADDLRVYHYNGINSYRKEQADAKAEHLLQFDVVLLTYLVLGKEIYYAETPTPRTLRGTKKHVHPRSPLMDLSWWRVCLDEAQMVENGLSHSATVARLIPRVNVWAVSGTPFKSHVQDLLGLLSFLRLSPFSEKKVWQKVDKETFGQIFGTIAIRHTKEKVRHELRLPPQKRVVITVPFTAIEEQNYTTLFRTMCEECGLNADGSSDSDDFDPQSPELIAKMKAWLRRLRQTCLHPQVGGSNRRALGHSNAPLRTVFEVLQVMIETNEASIRHEERQSLLAQVLQGHIIACDKGNLHRSINALEIYRAALMEADGLVDKRRRELSAAKLEAEFEKHDPEQKDTSNTTRTLRSELELQHICTFFVATAYYLIKEDLPPTGKDSEEYKRLEELETTHYDKAKAIRKEMLTESLAKAEGSMQEIRELQLKEIKDVSLPKYGAGIENRKFMEKFHEVATILNEQAVHLRNWRKKVCDILLKPLVDADKEEEQTGIEYEDSTKEQDKLYVLFQVLRTYAADRHGVITGQLNTLSEYEAKEALRQAKAGEGHAPELLIEYMADWQKLRAKPDNGSLRGVIVDFRSLVSKLEWKTDEKNMEGIRARAELGIVEPQINHLQKISTSLLKGVVDLEKELDFFRNCMNLRLEYYRQLQAISDTVRPYKEELDESLDAVELEKAAKKLEGAQDRLAAHQTKHRFLMHLRDESSQDEQRICVICQSTFEVSI
jgi:E3 ubiquitin-protein ligase SHPRH